MRTDNKKRATVLVFSCDSYEDAWYPFFALLDKYWADCPYDILLNTETKECKVPLKNITVKTLGLYKDCNKKVPYGKRCIDHLNAIDTDYVITLMDDFFVRSKVDTAALEQVMDWMDADKRIASFCLLHHDDRHSCKYSREEEGYKNYSLRPRYCNHNYDMQSCVWRRDAFIKSWRPYESPWEWEGPSNIRSFDDGYLYYDLDDDADFPIDYIDYKKHEWSGIRKGKWVKKTVSELFKNNDIEVDYSVRGFFDEEKDATPVKHTLKNELRELRSYGYKRFVPATWFKVKRLLATRVLKKDYPVSYCEYLRHKYYDKV